MELGTDVNESCLSDHIEKVEVQPLLTAGSQDVETGSCEDVVPGFVEETVVVTSETDEDTETQQIDLPATNIVRVGNTFYVVTRNPNVDGTDSDVMTEDINALQTTMVDASTHVVNFEEVQSEDCSIGTSVEQQNSEIELQAHLSSTDQGSSDQTSLDNYEQYMNMTEEIRDNSHVVTLKEIRDTNKREKDRIKKREKRKDPAYREKERLEARARMRGLRDDAGYRDNERVRDKLRRRIARRQNSDVRQRERERDREYKKITRKSDIIEELVHRATIVQYRVSDFPPDAQFLNVINATDEQISPIIDSHLSWNDAAQRTLVEDVGNIVHLVEDGNVIELNVDD